MTGAVWCRHCSLPLQRGPAGEWVHAASRRVMCRDGRHAAEPDTDPDE